MNDLPENDRELTTRLNASLERAAARPDATLDQALAATRARIRGEASPARRPVRPWLWASSLALAASLAVVMVMVLPRTPQPTSPHSLPDVQVQALVTAPAEDPDLLDDMDMLMALGNNQHQQG